jgi:peroxiredoxin
LIAKITIGGAPRPMALPAAASLTAHRLPDINPATVTGTQYAFYGLAFPPRDIKFFISRVNLAPGQVPTEEEFKPTNPRILILNHTERWLIGTRNGNNVGQFHPFHIHTNPFLIKKVTRVVNGAVVDVTAQEIGGPTWRDTLAMKQGYTYELLTKYADFTGSFVQHCHILDHEDSGMMELVRIDATAPAPPVAAAPVKIKALQTGSSIPPAAGKPSLLLFVKGSLCPHCMEQLAATNRELVGLNCNISVISASTEDDLQSFPAFPFTLVADPEYRLFKEHGAFDGEPKHGTLVRDRKGSQVFRRVGDEPFTDMAAIAAAIVAAGGEAKAVQTQASQRGPGARSQ